MHSELVRRIALCRRPKGRLVHRGRVRFEGCLAVVRVLESGCHGVDRHSALAITSVGRCCR